MCNEFLHSNLIMLGNMSVALDINYITYRREGETAHCVFVGCSCVYKSVSVTIETRPD
uniref:Uncharacterized protein n=1 Tax=Arion vulgaris TaxID=1028688 RepID=A0A0B6YS17_9EUPU